ncbi:conserved hypothetical protein [Coccidioides posadasii str. Silveira]|uniref:Uncharacterized protein n=1 Tax=Coccidioides posadasii (strain RMSCC 757 / Silveira) TaxID=443226 RepID=E9D5R9_COCPS|nr:conserved hypothetical protein [Coccidioides posadasii str. Silveira]
MGNNFDASHGAAPLSPELSRDPSPQTSLGRTTITWKLGPGCQSARSLFAISTTRVDTALRCNFPPPTIPPLKHFGHDIITAKHPSDHGLRDRSIEYGVGSTL